MKNPNSFFTADTSKLITRSIGTVMLIGVLSACANEGEPRVDSHKITSPTQHIDILDNQTLEPSVAPIHPDIEKNIPASSIEAVNLFNATNVDIHEYRVYRQGNFIDLVPPVQDGVFSIILPNKNDNPAGYSFNGELTTDADGKVVGDLLIGGHTNSGGDWQMNNIGLLKVGDTQVITYENAIYLTEVTKITYIKKTGNVHAWPGFDKALGEDGAIFGCRLTKDENGNTIQSGDVTIVGIKIISAEHNN